MSLIDAQLYRPLKDGKQYEGLIPKYQGTTHYFDKESDSINTFDTMRYMEKWVNKYAHQMAKVAPLLKGRNLQETANKIYKFLYDHFQYKLDGGLQNLYSPSAAWHFRKTGFDCKTYSVLASTIMRNLGIPHAFRQVQQAGIMPGEWSHVYVIVPNGNHHYVIDATTHTNKEVSFTNKYDYTMRHRGLASPAIDFSGLGCACQGTPLRQSGLGAPSTLANTIKNFHSFLDQLESQGVSKDVTNKMLTLVRYNVERGVDPNMGEILKKALCGTEPMGLGAIEPISLYSPVSGSYNTMSYSLPTTTYSPTTSAFSGLLSDAKTAGTSALSNISVGGVKVGNLATDLATGNFVGAGLNVLKAIIPMEKTFGAVFANGFDLSCWGASYSEQKAKIDIQADLPYMVNWSGIYQQPTTENLDKFMLVTQSYYDEAVSPDRKNFAKCSRKGHALRAKAILQLQKDTLSNFTAQNFQLVANGKKTSKINIPGGLPAFHKGKPWTGWGGRDVSFDSYTVVSPSQVAAQAAASETATSDTGAATGTTKATKKSSSTPFLVGAAILAAKVLL